MGWWGYAKREEFHGFQRSADHTWRFGKIQDFAGETVAVNRHVGITRMAFWHDPGSPCRNNHLDPWRGNPENTVTAFPRVFKPFSPKRQIPQWQ
eukprot:2633064-Pyramimonas_sp.AAC.1